MNIHNNLHFRASNCHNFQSPLEVRASCTQLFTHVALMVKARQLNPCTW